MSKPSLYRMINIGEFPRPVPIGRQRVAFIEAEVQSWITTRIARSVSDLFAMLEGLKAKGVAVTFLDNPSMNLDTAHGELLLAILGAVGGFERKLIIARTAEGRTVAKRKGVKFGRKAKVSAALGEQVKAKVAEGLSMGDAAKALGIGRATAYRAINA